MQLPLKDKEAEGVCAGPGANCEQTARLGSGCPTPIPDQEAKLQGGQRSGDLGDHPGGMGQALHPTPFPLTGLLRRVYGLQFPAGTHQQECSRGFPVGIIWAGMFSWVSCWNSVKNAFILSAVCFWGLWGAESRGIPKPSPPSLPTAARHAISVEALGQ